MRLFQGLYNVGISLIVLVYMTNYVKFIVVLCVGMTMALSCRREVPSENYMVLEDIRYVKEFPRIYTLEQPLPVNLDLMGVLDFVIRDSLMIATTMENNGFWTFLSLPDCRLLGKYLTIGNGPSEFIQRPWVGEARLCTDDENCLNAYVYDFSKGRLFRMNIGTTLQTGKLDIGVVNDSLPSSLFGFVFIDSTTYFCRAISADQTQQTRYLKKGRETEIPLSFERLNRSRVRPQEDFNILSASVKCQPGGNILVELPIGLNHINMYDLEGAFGKTICVGDKVDNIDLIQDMPRADRLYTYAHLKVYPDFFAVLYVGEDVATYQTQRKKLPVIQLFDWSGEPLAELKVDRFITTFDIDFSDGTLYVMDRPTEEMFKYDIRDILAQI